MAEQKPRRHPSPQEQHGLRARFAKQYDQLRAEHCGSDANRNREFNREFNRALEILERTCQCDNDKMLMPDGKLAELCRECQETEERGRQQRRSR